MRTSRACTAYAGPQVELTPDTVAVCVISDTAIRHACYGIVWTGSAPSSTGPIPLDAPAVSHPAWLGNFHTWDDHDPPVHTLPVIPCE